MMNKETLDGIAYAVENMRMSIWEAMAQVQSAAHQANSRQARRERIVCAVLSTAGKDRGALDDWDHERLMEYAESVLDASDAVDKSGPESPDAK